MVQVKMQPLAFGANPAWPPTRRDKAARYQSSIGIIAFGSTGTPKQGGGRCDGPGSYKTHQDTSPEVWSLLACFAKDAMASTAPFPPEVSIACRACLKNQRSIPKPALSLPRAASGLWVPREALHSLCLGQPD